MVSVLLFSCFVILGRFLFCLVEVWIVFLEIWVVRRSGGWLRFFALFLLGLGAVISFFLELEFW